MRTTGRGRVVRRLFCGKAGKPYALATLRIGGTGPVVRLRGMVATGRGGMRESPTGITADDVADFASFYEQGTTLLLHRAAPRTLRSYAHIQSVLPMLRDSDQPCREMAPLGAMGGHDRGR